MADAEIERLEREVEAARARVSANVARLKSPGSFDELKREITAEALATKDDFVERTREAATDSMQGMLDGVKARIAANPVAALAVGAGVAWRLTRHPPVATALLGYGLFSLFRTDPKEPHAGADLIERATEMAGVTSRRVGEAAHRLGDAAQVAKENVTDLASEAGATTRETAVRVRETAGEWGESGRQMATRARYAAEEWGESGRQVVTRAMHHEDRDKYLFGAAALALAAAIGIAYAKRADDD